MRKKPLLFSWGHQSTSTDWNSGTLKMCGTPRHQPRGPFHWSDLDALKIVIAVKDHIPGMLQGHGTKCQDGLTALTGASLVTSSNVFPLSLLDSYPNIILAALRQCIVSPTGFLMVMTTCPAQIGSSKQHSKGLHTVNGGF